MSFVRRVDLPSGVKKRPWRSRRSQITGLTSVFFVERTTNSKPRPSPWQYVCARAAYLRLCDFVEHDRRFLLTTPDRYRP